MNKILNTRINYNLTNIIGSYLLSTLTNKYYFFNQLLYKTRDIVYDLNNNKCFDISSQMSYFRYFKSKIRHIIFKNKTYYF